jgi:hypothetical protein
VGKKITIEQVKSAFEGRGWKLRSSEYSGAYSLLDFTCDRGHQYQTSWNSVNRGYGCGECGGKKKITIEHIRSEFEKKGWTLLSTKYVDNQTPLDFVCGNGHQNQIRWNGFKNGRGCIFCAGQAKPTIESVRSAFEQRGWVLLSDEYINNQSPLGFVCDSGHEHQISWAALNRGYGCSKCSGKAKHTIEFIRSEFEKRGWVLKSTEYNGAHSPLDFVCDKGHDYQIRWANLSQGQGCGHCAGKKRITIQYVRSEFEKRGWVLKSTKYVSPNSPLNFACNNGHQHHIRWNDFNNGIGCTYCSGTARVTIERVKLAFKERGWELLSDNCINSKSPLDFVCDKGHKHRIDWASFNGGTGCGQCHLNGFNFSKPSIFYYARITTSLFNKPFYKVGITSKSAQDRLNELQVEYTLIDTVNFDSGYEAFDYEQGIIKKFERHRADPEIARLVLPISGYTELFDIDILKADAELIDVC